MLFTQSALALTFTGFTDKFNYKINETINYTGVADQNLTSNVTIYLLNSSGTQFNFTSIVPNATNFTAQVNATVPRSGDYFVKANFTFNSTYFESSSIVKISRAHSTVIGTNKGTYSPGETINFTVRATDANNIGVSDENITVRLLYGNNGTVLSSKSGSTNSAGEYTGTFTTPSTIGSYRLTVNEWVATKIIDISTFDLVAFTGDADGNIKTNFAAGDTAFVYMDLFDSNKTRFTGTETLSVQLTYPNGNQNASVSYTFSGSRLNTSFTVNGTGIFNVKVTAVSTSKSINIPVLAGKYEIAGWLEKNTTATNTFFGNDPVNIRVKVFNVSTGETIKTTLDDTFELNLLDSVFTNVSSISNTATLDSATGIRTFTFNTPNTTGLYYVKVRLNQSEIDIDMKVTNTISTATPVDQSYNFKNAFVGSKQTIRIMATLSNSTSSINVTNVSVVSVRTSTGSDVTSSLTFNASIVDHKDAKVGLVEFSAPAGAGLYFIKTLANNNFAAETQFLIKLYTVCAQLDGYRWFISSNEDVNLTIKVSEAQDVSLIDSLSGNSSDSTSTEGGSFGNMYGMHDCYGAYKTTASGSNTTGNSVAGIVVAVKKIFNTLNGEDVTTKVANPPSNNTDDNGKVALRLSKPSGGWDGGTYVVELELRDKNNNTDKGFGSFQVKNLWVNVWPQQISGRWKWYFSPTENMTFQVNSYNSTGTWYYYGQGQGTGDNCYVLEIFYQGNGAEWFWPPKKIPSNKYNWTCTNSTAPAKGNFTLKVNHTTAFDSGYYMVRVKVNTTAGVGDSGEGWLAVKAYNVYVRTTSSNYYESWYRSATDNITLDVDVTYANSTVWDCYWRKCPASELVTDNINISTKVIKYDEWKQKDYPTSKYTASFTNNSFLSTTTSSLTTFQNVGSQTNVSINSTKSVTDVISTFQSGGSSVSSNNVTLASAGSNASTTISIPKNATINSASVTISPLTSNLIINVSLNETSAFHNTTSNSSVGSSNVSFATSLTSVLSSCTDVNGNCTIGFNVTLNGSGTVGLSSLQISYNQLRTANSGSNSSTLITIPKNSTINSAFISINATSGNFAANLTLNDTNFATNDLTHLGPSFFNTTNLNTTANNVSFGSALSRALSLCSSISGNCTLGFNVTLNGTGTVTLSSLSISSATNQTIQNTSLWYINTTSGNANLTFIPRGGKNSNTWETGYYSAAVIVDGPQGKETGTYWFEIRSFFVNLQTVKPTDFKQTTYAYTSGQNIIVNVSATDRPSWLTSSYNVSATNIAANITAMRLSYWDQTTYQMKQTSVTWTPSAINGTATVNITPSSTLATGNWYNLEVTLTDSSGNNQTGWASFQIKDFTFSARTKNWQYEFSNLENISLDVAVCGGDTWYCNFGFNNYSGAAVNVTVTKLAKSDTWPYTPVSAWNANSSILNSTNNGQGIVTITPTSALSGGYYTADLTARYNDGSGSPVTTNVWFRIQSFKLSVNTLQWQYRMSDNVTLRITSSAAATLTNAQISCGYWPDQTYYTLGSSLAANSTSISAGENLIMLSPSGGNSWVSGYCYGSIQVTSGGENQNAYISFNMQSFTLSISQSKYKYLKNESIILKLSSDSTQQFNISDINITFYNYENNSNMLFRLGQHFNTNGTNQKFTGNATINITPSSGNWSLRGWHNGQIKAIDGNNSAISQTAWFYFDMSDLLTAWGYPVSSGTSNYYTYNTSSETISLLVNTFKYNSAKTSWDPFDRTGGINVTVTSIEKQSCATYPCAYSNVTGWTAPTATSKSGGTAQVNITRSGGWSSGWHYMNVKLAENSTGETVSLNRYIGFWVNS